MQTLQKKGKKRPRKDDKILDEDRIGFVKVEDEAWLQLAAHKIMWPVGKDSSQRANTGRNVVALIMAAKHVNDLRKTVDSLVVLEESTDAKEGDDKKKE